jgi:hypothetical protein
MKHIESHSPTGVTRGRCRHGAASWAAAVFGIFVLSSLGQAQSAANFQPPAGKTRAMEEAAPERAAAISIPSRLVATDEVGAYIEEIRATFSMRERETDPFGQYQDPDAKPIVKPVLASSSRPAQMQATPFADIVRLIVISTIMPGEKRFLIGTRSVAQGDILPLNFRGRQIRVQVTEVTGRQIGFRNLESGETAARKLDMLPAGMSMGNSQLISAPGMVRDRPDSPIDLDAGNP